MVSMNWGQYRLQGHSSQTHCAFVFWQHWQGLVMKGCKGSGVVSMDTVVGTKVSFMQKSTLHTHYSFFYIRRARLVSWTLPFFPRFLYLVSIIQRVIKFPFFTTIVMVLVKDQDGVTRKYACITCIKASWTLIVATHWHGGKADCVVYWSRDIDRPNVSTRIVALSRSKGKEGRWVSATLAGSFEWRRRCISNAAVGIKVAIAVLKVSYPGWITLPSS